MTYKNKDTLEICGRSGCASIFGLPFLLGGLFVLQMPLGIVPVQGCPSDPMTLIIIALIGGGNVIGGTCLLFGRSGIIVDRGRGHIIKWWGLLVPMKRSTYPLNLIHHVDIKYDNSGDGAATWPITLSGKNIAQPISIFRPTSMSEATHAGKELARFLNKPLVDSSIGDSVTRDPEFLDESYGDRIRRTREAVSDLPAEPYGTRLKLERTKEGFILHIPESAKNSIHYIPLLLSLVFSGAVAYSFLPSLFPVHDPSGYYLIGLVGFFIVAPILGGMVIMVSRKKQFERIIVTKNILRVEALKEGKRTTEEIPLVKLEDLVAPPTMQSALKSAQVSGMQNVPMGDTGSPRMPDGRLIPSWMLSLLSLIKMAGSRGIIARSDTTTIEFAVGLDEAEVAWIFALIKKTIAANSSAT